MLNKVSSFSGPLTKLPKSKTNDSFNYDNFISTQGLNLVSTYGISNNWIYITNNTNANVGNIYRSNKIKYNRNFSLQWNFECSDGTGADGFSIQWTQTNNSNGVSGGGVGRITSAINAITFLTFTNNNVTWYKNNTSQGAETQAISFRQNVYYWLDYNHSNGTAKVYYSTSNIKPVTEQHSYTNFTFDNNNYYLGIGAATGGSNDNHILKSLKLTF